MTRTKGHGRALAIEVERSLRGEMASESRDATDRKNEMYGMVNGAVRDLVLKRFGAQTWTNIKHRAGLTVDTFITNQGYDDSVTYALVAAASEELGTPADRVLELFGEHWVLETAPHHYGAMMDAGGASLAEFLERLPDFHARVVLVLPKLQPPEFRVTDRTESSLVLHYHSHRPGLQPFVVGLVKGLGKRFQTDVEVHLTRGRHDGLDHDEFLVRWSGASSTTTR